MDLRKFALDLVGVKFKKSGKRDGHLLEIERTFTIEEVFPYHVRCFSECENGYRIIECFSIGDLILAGALKKR